jgi:hypothetical protein
MPRSEKPALLQWLYRSEFESVVPLKALLQRGAHVVLGKDTPAAEAYAESNLNAFWNYLLKEQESDSQRGVSRVFEIVDPMARTLRWCPLPPHSCSLQARRTRRLRHRPAMLSMIDTLNNREYEALACASLSLVGASETFLTPPGNEGGVDFFALLPSPGRCHLFSGGHHPLRIVGQSKKYASAMEAGEFKEFLTTMEEVKHGGQPKTDKIVPAWFRAVYGPIVGLVIAHSGFQSGATTRARQHGILTAESLDMAEMVALSKMIPEYLAGVDRAMEFKKRIRALLA